MVRSLSCSTIALIFAVFALRAAPTPEPEVNRASKILTAEEASKILGAVAEPSLRNQLPDADENQTWTSTASWSTTIGTNRRTLTLLIRHGENAAKTQSSFEMSRDVLKGDPVADLGDAAFRTENPAQLNVRIGADWLILSVCTLIAPDPALQEKAAHEVLAKWAK